MKHLLRYGSIILLTSFFAFPLFAEYSPERSVTVQEFQNALVESLTRMKETLNRRTYRIQAINQSLQKTIDAVNLLAEKNDLSGAETQLREALELLSNNVLAELVLADVYEKQGNIESANAQYKKFLDKSGAMSSLNQDIMNWKIKLTLSSYARTRLRAQGIEVPEPAALPLIARLETEKNGLLQLISFGLPITLVFSMFFLIFGYAMTDGDITRLGYYRVCSRLFFVMVLSYGLWLSHVFLQTPPYFRNEELEVVTLITLGALLIWAVEIYSAVQKRREDRSNPSMTLCRKCKNLIEKLAAFCPHCSESQTSRQ